MRLVSDKFRRRLSHQVVAFAEQWMMFVMRKCERGQGVKPRWASQGLEFLMNVCEPSVLTVQTDQEFLELKTKISLCISHVIGDKTIPGGRQARLSVPDTSSKLMIQRIQSCPASDTRREQCTTGTKLATSVSDPADTGEGEMVHVAVTFCVEPSTVLGMRFHVACTAMWHAVACDTGNQNFMASHIWATDANVGWQLCYEGW